MLSTAVWGGVDLANGVGRLWKPAGIELGDWGNCEDYVETALSERAGVGPLNTVIDSRVDLDEVPTNITTVNM